MSKSKLEKLVELAILNDSQVSNVIRPRNIMRLNSGDLSHIGDALLLGNKILSSCENGEVMAFNSDYSHSYTIAPRTIMIGGVECVAPESVAPSHGSEYWLIDELGAAQNVWVGDPTDKRLLKAANIWLDKEHAQQVFDAQKSVRLGNGGNG